MKTVSPLAFILLLAMQPANRVLWLLLLFALGVTCYITHIAEPANKKKVPARGANPDKHNW